MANKVGRPRNVKSPEELWGYFEAYRIHVKSNPFIKYEVSTKGGTVAVPLEKPLTIDGFFCWCWDNGVGDILRYMNGDYEEFVSISTRIRQAVRDEQVTGGMVGAYNASLTARVNGLVDKSEQTVKKEPRVFNVD